MTHHTNIYLAIMFTLFCAAAAIGLTWWANVLEVMP